MVRRDVQSMHREPRFLGDDVLHEVAGKGRSPMHEKLEKYEAIHNDQELSDDVPDEFASRRSEEARRNKRVVHVACLTKGEAGWVIACEDDHEEEVRQFDGEIVKKMTIYEISTFLSTVDN